MLVTLLFMNLTLAIQASPGAAPVQDIDVPTTALRDPHGWVLSQCSPLVLPRTASPEACEARHWAALQALDPDIGGPRPAGSRVAASEPEPEARSVFGGRCQASSRASATEGESSASAEIICGNGNEATRQVLRGLLRPQG